MRHTLYVQWVGQPLLWIALMLVGSTVSRTARLAVPAAMCGLAMLGAHLGLHAAAWPVDLVGTAFAGGIVYLPALLFLGLTPTEKGLVLGAARRARSSA